MGLSNQPVHQNTEAKEAAFRQAADAMKASP